MAISSISPTASTVSSWRDSLADWASSGALMSAIQSALAPNAQVEKLVPLINSIKDGDSSVFPGVQVLDSQSLRGRLGAYSSSRNTIYLSSELDTSPSMVSIVLTHELGHFIQDHILGGGKATVINDFVAALIPSSAEVFNAIRQAGDASVLPAGSISLPNGESVKAKFFDTSLHINAEDRVLEFMQDNALNRMALAQNHVDDVSPRNQFSLQYRSAAHFDNSNIAGSLAMIRGWYEDALENFSKSDIKESKWSKATKWAGFKDAGINTTDPKWLSGKVNPAFAGENGGIDLLLYRFGQICHAFQDFYSHSNWLALVGDDRRRPLPTGSILDSGLDLPTVLKPGDALPGAKPGMTALVASKGPDWTKILNLAGRGGKYIYGSDQDVYWMVKSDDSSKYVGPTKIFGLADPRMSATTRNDNKPVYGLASGATWKLVYKDEDLSLKFRDPQKEGLDFSHEYFNGFDHGGLAGTSLPVNNPISGKPFNTYLGPLSKDTKDSFGHDDAMKYANTQIKNEWDRLGNLIFSRYGQSGLERFANYALFPEERQLYINTYSKPGGRWSWPIKDDLYYFTVEVTSPESFGVLGGAEIRFINIASRSEADPASQELTIGLQYKVPGGLWADSALTDLSSLDRHGDISDNTWRQILAPRSTSHSAAGARAYWLDSNPAEAEGGGISYVVEVLNSDLQILLPGFDPARDQIVVVGANGEQLAAYTGNWSVGEYAANRQELLDKYNILIDAPPLPLVDSQSWVIDKSKLVLANGTAAGVSLSASDLFVDYDKFLPSGSNELLFAHYDNTLPFLSLIDGKLVANSDLGKYAGRTYTALVSVSDGLFSIADHAISIAVAPSLTTGKGDSFSPGQLYQIQFLDQDGQYYSLFEAIDQDNDQPGIDRLSVLASVTGNVNGNPVGWNPLSQVARLGAASDSGTISFWLQKQDSASPIKLSSVQNSYNGYDLSLSDKLIARLSAVVEPVKEGAVPFEIDTFSVADASADVAGFRLSKDVSSFRIDYITNGSAAYSSRLGFVMIDLRTGDIVDPVTGHSFEGNAESFASSTAQHALFEMPIVRGQNLPGSVELKVDQSIDVRNIVFTPFVKTDAGGIQRLYSGNPLFNADGLEHVIKVGATVLGVEDMFAQVDGDYNDVLFSVSGVTQL
jgi:hypothetical protein